MKNFMVLSICIGVMIFAFSACSGFQNPSTENQQTDQNQTSLDQSANKKSNNFKTDTGKYVGQIDGNSIEIKISGVPDELSSKTFRLGSKVKDNFKDYKLETNDIIKFEYELNEHNQPVITKIEKINPVNNKFSIKINDETIKLGDWDNEIDLVKILGEPLKENIKVLGSEADTFTGSHIKTM